MIKTVLLVSLLFSSMTWTTEKPTIMIAPAPENIRHNPFPVQSPWNGIYAHGVTTPSQGRYMHVSGQLGFTESGTMSDSFADQANQAIDNISNVLRSADMQMNHIVHMRFYLTERSQVDDLVKVRMDKLYGLAPAVTTYIVGGLLKEEWLVEIEALAFKPEVKIE